MIKHRCAGMVEMRRVRGCLFRDGDGDEDEEVEDQIVVSEERDPPFEASNIN